MSPTNTLGHVAFYYKSHPRKSLEATAKAWISMNASVETQGDRTSMTLQ